MNKLIYYIFVISLSIITINGCCFPKQIKMELNFGGTSNCYMNMSKIGNIIVGIFGCPDMNINLTSQNNTFCDNYNGVCTYPNVLNINKQFMPQNNNINISLATLNICGASLGTIRSIYITAFVYLQIINNNIAIISLNSYCALCMGQWKCPSLLSINNVSFSYII